MLKTRNLYFISHTLLLIGALFISPGMYAGVNLQKGSDVALVKESYALLQARDYAGALGKAKRATAINSGLPDAWFLQGLALNRLGRPAKALTALQRARKSGLSGPSLDYEIGWAAVFVGDWDVAVEHLERYESAKPGSARTGTSLGLALLGQGKLDKAEAKLREAMARDPKRKPSALYLLSQIEGARGNIPAARQHLKQIMVQTPDSAMGRSLWGGLASEAQRARTGAERDKAPRKPWQVSASLSRGHNDNVIALGDGLPLPTDISNENSDFTQFALSATYDQLLSQDSGMTYGYSLNSNFYGDLEGFDVIDHYFYLRYSKRLRPDLIGTLTGSDQYTIADSDGFRNEVGLRPALLYKVNDDTTVEVAYRYADSNYLNHVAIAALDRDAQTHTLSVNGYFKIPNTEVSLQAGFFHTENNTDGRNYESDTDSLQVAVQSPLIWKIDGYASITRSNSDYDNPDLFSATGADRDDDVDRFTLRLTRPMTKDISIYARFDHTNHDSNIPVFNYDQHILSAGLIMGF